MTIDEEQALQLLRAECNRAGSMMAWAKAHGFSTAFISQVLGRQRSLTDRVLEALNLTKVVMYVQE